MNDKDKKLIEYSDSFLGAITNDVIDINENRRLIEYCEKSFIDLLTKDCISFQSIVSIDPIKIKRDDDFNLIRIGLRNKYDACGRIQYYFKINLINGKDHVIGYDYSIKLFNCVKRKNKFMNFLFGDKFVKNEQLDLFYLKQTDIMKEDMEILKSTRNELIKKFNEWKGK